MTPWEWGKYIKGWRIFDEATQMYWYKPGTILPAEFPSKAAAKQALRNWAHLIVPDCRFQTKIRPELRVVPYYGQKEERSQIQKAVGARRLDIPGLS